MGFEIAHETPHIVWMPLVDSDTCYIGQIVKHSAEGVTPLGAASGAYDTTNKAIPYGIVVGTSDTADNETFNSTYKAASITDATPFGSTTERRLIEGPWVKGDRQAMVAVALIKPGTIIRGRIFNAAYGTAPTVGSVTTGSGSGLQATGTSALSDVAGVANLATAYFRAGANRGQYRITDDTDNGTTAITWDKPTVAAVAVGDTIVRVNGLRVGGLSRAQFDSESTYIDCSAALTSDYWGIIVTKLDLRTAGNEHVEFFFCGEHFAPARA